MEWQVALKPLISLVSGTWNRFELLKNMIQSFRDELPKHFPYEIIIVDGGSDDGTIEWCLTQPDIKLIQHGALKGAIKAFTDGARAASGDFVILANDDIKFGEDSVLIAYAYLQDHPRTGAVAFQDNRPIPNYVDDTVFKTLKMPAVRNGRAVSVIYAQVGMFRKWQGDKINWWLGANGEMAGARTYAGDNFLSAKIWQMGYSVDEVPGCYVIDYVVEDELRVINRADGKIASVSDSMVYYNMWGKDGGPHIPPAQVEQQQDAPSIRVLYLPIYEPGWVVQKEQKRGLRDALMRARTPKGWGISVYEMDYLAIPPSQLEAEVLHAAAVFNPRIILTQIQSARPLTALILSHLRSLLPRASIINWNGDVAEGGLVSPDMLQLLRYVDLQLTVNASVLDTYKMHQIPAAYWQIGYEEPSEPLPDMPAHDVVFMGSFSNPARLPLKDALERLQNEGRNVGIYQPGDTTATLYDFAKGMALYRNSRLSVGSNEYPNSYGFVSNRMFQAIAAGGALYLQQRVHGIQELTGITPGVHFVEWTDYEDFHSKVQWYLDPAHEDERRKIADAGTAFVRRYHSFDHRVIELFELMKEHLQPHHDPTANAVYLKYKGPRTDQFGAGVSRVNEGMKYICEPGQLMLVDKLDAPYFLSEPNLWEVSHEE